MVISPSTRGEHLLQYGKHLQQGGLSQHPEVLHQTFTIHRAELIRHYMPILAFKRAWDSKGVGMASGGQRGNDEGSHVCVEFIG